MADWEFDGSVDFAPPHYRKEKYEEAERFEITDEESAKEYINLMDYLHYLHGDDEYYDNQGHNIDNWEQMLQKEAQAWELIKDEEFIYRNITYDLHHKIWRAGFDYLRSLESPVIRGEISKKQYSIMITEFNNAMKPLNKHADKYGLIGHTLYWIQNRPLQVEMKKKYGV